MVNVHLARRLRTALMASAACIAVTFSASSPADDAKPGPMQGNESSKPTAEATAPDEPASSATAKPPLEAETLFRSICSYCHEDGGRRPGKGPQLMGTPLTDEEVFNRIKFGKPGRMAGFGGTFSDDQIKLIVVYIRNLKPRP